ncbi:MAG: GH3 auxin-responsive promoter family protein, partial [Deltaproteobacteria bacterium]
MSLASLAIRILSKQSAKRFETATRDPVTTQTEKLQHLMQKNAGTEYGQRYGFKDIKSFEDYRRQVPVIGYENIKEDMQRVVDGQLNIFTAENPVMFAQTSGTTGDPKYIPVTPTCQGSEHKDVMRTWMSHALKAHPDMFAGQVVTLVSPAVEGHTPSGMPYGATSGHMYKNQPGLVRRIYAIPYEVYEVEDYAAKYFTIMRTALEMDIRFLATANPSSILKLCEKADEYAEQIIRDIHDGTLSSDFNIEPAIRSILTQGYKPNPSVAKALEAARSKRGDKLIPADYWPRLSLIGCWKGGTVGHNLKKFPAWFDPDNRRAIPVRDWGYLSSEARGSIPLSDEGSAGVLTVASNIFEFVPVAELEAQPDNPENWPFLNIGEIEEGHEYYIFFTTTGGLYRYDINDVIKVVDFYNRTPQVIFLRKGRGMTNLTGEKVSVNQVITVMQKASQTTGAVVDHFRAEADIDTSRYLFRVEFATKTDDATRQAFLKNIDVEMKAINIEYKGKRESLRLEAPVMHVMKEGWYERGRQKQVEAGMRAFQAKTT